MEIEDYDRYYRCINTFCHIETPDETLKTKRLIDAILDGNLFEHIMNCNFCDIHNILDYIEDWKGTPCHIPRIKNEDHTSYMVIIDDLTIKVYYNNGHYGLEHFTFCIYNKKVVYKTENIDCYLENCGYECNNICKYNIGHYLIGPQTKSARN
jgi:hypothetical protein